MISRATRPPSQNKQTNKTRTKQNKQINNNNNNNNTNKQTNKQNFDVLQVGHCDLRVELLCMTTTQVVAEFNRYWEYP